MSLGARGILVLALGAAPGLSLSPGRLPGQSIEGVRADGFFDSYPVLGPYNNPAGWDIPTADQALDFYLCPDASDADDTGRIDISDPVYLLSWRFGTGSPPPSPFPECGSDVTDDDPDACEAAPLCA